MSIILNDLNIRIIDAAVKEAGSDATIDRLRYVAEEHGNKAYFDADQRLNPEKIEISFKPLGEGTEIESLRKHFAVIKLLEGVPEFKSSFSFMEHWFRNLYKNKNIIDLVHLTTHTLGIEHTPRGELVTIFAEKILYKSDALTHLLCSTYLTLPPLSMVPIRGLKADELNFGKSHNMMATAAANYMYSDGYVKPEFRDESFFNPIIYDGQKPSPVQVTVGEVLEVVAAAKLAEQRFFNQIGIPLSHIELLKLPEHAAKLFVLNDGDRRVVEALVYPETSNPEIKKRIESNYKGLPSFVDKVRRDLFTYLNHLSR